MGGEERRVGGSHRRGRTLAEEDLHLVEEDTAGTAAGGEDALAKDDAEARWLARMDASLQLSMGSAEPTALSVSSEGKVEAGDRLGKVDRKRIAREARHKAKAALAGQGGCRGARGHSPGLAGL